MPKLLVSGLSEAEFERIKSQKTERTEAVLVASNGSIPSWERVTDLERNLILVSVCLGQFLAALDITIVVVALPKILADLDGVDLLAWTLSSYLLTSAAVNGLVGRLSDVYGRRIVYLSAMAIFFLGSALCGSATSIWNLIIARGVQGIGGGGLMGLTQVIVADVVPPDRRAKITSAVMSTFAFAVS